MTRLEEMVRAYICDLVYPMQPAEDAVKKTVRDVQELMQPWMQAVSPPLIQKK